MDNPKVSIIMSNYNCCRFIGRAIESVLSQTYQDYEFIIIDDCSTDSSKNIIESYDDPRIRKFYFNQNEKMCYASNFALNKIRGQYVARIDSDDVWSKEKLSKQMNYMEKHSECGACFTKVTAIDEVDEENLEKTELFDVDNCSRPEWIRRFYFTGCCVCHSSAVIRNSVLDSIGVYSYALRQLHDYDLWIRIVKKYDIYVMEECLTYYRWFKSGENASAPSPDVNRRTEYELAYVLSRYFDDISDKMLVQAFKNDFVRQEASTPEELLIERALLLLKPVFSGTLYKMGGLDRLVTLLQEEKTRIVLRENYGITQKSFYAMSAEYIKELMEGQQQYVDFLEKIKDEQSGCINELKKGLDTQNNYVAALENNIQILDNAAKTQQSTVEELDKGLHAQNKYVASLEKEIKDRKNCIDELNQGIQKQSEYIASLEKNVKDRGNCIDELNQGIQKQGEYIAMLEDNIKTQQTYIEHNEEIMQELRSNEEKSEKRNKTNEVKISEQKTLIERQQARLMEQAAFINKAKSSLYGRLFLQK